jgi:hypothetical protein
MIAAHAFMGINNALASAGSLFDLRRAVLHGPLPRLRGRDRERADTARPSKLALSPPLSRKREREQAAFVASALPFNTARRHP